MAKSNSYIGGSTILYAPSGWFSPYRKNPNVDPVTGETRSEVIQRLLVELEQSRQNREVQNDNEKSVKSTNNKAKLKISSRRDSANLTKPKSIAQQEERMSKIQVEVRRKKKTESK